MCREEGDFAVSRVLGLQKRSHVERLEPLERRGCRPVQWSELEFARPAKSLATDATIDVREAAEDAASRPGQTSRGENLQLEREQTRRCKSRREG
jgi:hypothetical protein